MTNDYKSTIRLPQTDFAMKAQLPKREPDMLAYWQETDLESQIEAVTADRPTFLLHDGPPYANGNIHLGHAMNKIIKDIINRTQRGLGKRTPFVPGWDCHGLPIEWKIEEKYRKAKKNKDDVPINEFRQECRDFAQHWIDVQREEFKRLGIGGDWDNPYTTMNHKAESRIAEELMKFLMNGGLYKGAKPVMWSVVEKTALAEAEVEYEDHTSTQVDVRFPVATTDIADLDGAAIVIWTTTPWTLPGNRAISYGPAMDYLIIKVTGTEEDSLAVIGETLAVGEALLTDVTARAGITEFDRLGSFKGDALANTVCHHPWHDKGYDFDIPLLGGEHVTTEAGTGFVHTAPGHGQEDYEVWLAHGHRQIPETVGPGGLFYDHVPLFAGQHVFRADNPVCDALVDVGALLAKGKLTHSYPHSWRSKAPLIFRNTPQWFISMDENDLRKKALKEIDRVRWVPDSGYNRMRSMVDSKPDWIVSRQRAWGVPITVFVNKESGEPLRDEAVNTRIARAFEEHGSDIWFAEDKAYFLGNDHDADDYDKVDDILDVWFDSGSSHAFVMEDRDNMDPPAALYMEGSDQHRGWFQSSLMESVGTRDKAPYDAVLTHGMALDKNGRKMSKSIGNTIDPQKIIDQYGADILRLWVAATDYTNDVRMGDEVLKGMADGYRKIRNTLRFMIGNLTEFNESERLDIAEMPELERYILHRMYEVDQIVRTAVDDFDFDRMYHALFQFCTVDLSALFFDIRKDALYCDAPGTMRRRAARTVLDEAFNHLVTWLAPILCFTAEEAWWERNGKDSSVHLETYFPVPAEWQNDALSAKWQHILTLRRVVTGALEIERREKRIGSSLQAAPTIYVDNAAYVTALDGVDLAEMAITSDATLIEGSAPIDAFRLDDVTGIGVVSALADGSKCDRCWQFLPEVGTDESHDDLCHRCIEAVS
jgi:isoleucyl-tRNA synthetase